jgi:cytochrome c556
MHRLLLAVPLVLATASAVAHAQEEEEPPSVEARHGIMNNYSFNLSTLGGMAKGEIEYDAETAQLAADRLATLSSIDWTGYWPEGTSSEDLDSSRALPEIWSDMEDFLSGFEEVQEAAMSMQEVAGDGQDALAGEMKGLGQSCGGCHDDYRMSDD